MSDRHLVTGIITAVQEQRFRILTSGGQTLLLTLHSHTQMPAHLSELESSQVLVRVEYEGEPNRPGGAARRITLI